MTDLGTKANFNLQCFSTVIIPLGYFKVCVKFNLRSSFIQTFVPNVRYQDSESLALWFFRIILKFFTLYGHGSHFGHVTYIMSSYLDYHAM